ncbi:MAG: tetratricopeptide repeat protein [Nitrospirae bacterium]|nr:tetratricopeptide repeat protein [Nitrospirota bacterium]
MTVINDLIHDENKRSTVYSLLLVFAIFAVYANSLGNGLVWDDKVVIVRPPILQDEPLSLFARIDSGRDVELTPYYRPMTQLSFLLEDRVHGLNPLLMHLFNIMLHAANAFLVYRLARSLIRDEHASFLAGLLFAVHPISTEAVDFLAGGRNTLLACFFSLTAYLLHRRSIFSDTISLAAAGAVFFLAGLFSKETGLMILPFIALQEISFLRGFSGMTYRAVVRLVPYVFCMAMYMVLRGRSLAAAGVQLDILNGLGARLLDNLYIIPRYLLTIIWPVSLSPKYVIPDDIHLLALPLIAAWLGIAGVIGWQLTRGRRRATLFGLSWLVVFWLPVSGIFPIPSAPMADRYFYVSAIGLWIIVADQLARLFSSVPEARRYGIAAAALVLLVLTAMTVARNQDWKNDISLFSRYVAQNPDQAFGHHNLGCAYLDDEGDLDAAEREFKMALALDPNFPRLRTQMGYIQLLRGDFAGAVRHYNEAIEQNPFDAEAYLNRATALDKLGKYEDAAADYRRYLAIPGNELAGARTMVREKVKGLSSQFRVRKNK